MLQEESAKEGGEDRKGKKEKLESAEGGCESKVGLFGEVGGS
jgi:hypothetical protein